MSKSSHTLIDPPETREIEISLFGPGFGECVLIHTGHDEWIIVDSCINPTTRQPYPINYLHDLGIDPSQAVKLVVATHWHDDHVDGLAEVFDSCHTAKFVCSGALEPKELYTLANVCGSRAAMVSSGIDELHKILTTLQRRSPSIRRASIGPKFAMAGLPIWERAGTAEESDLGCLVKALSPSDATKMLAINTLSPLLTSPHKPKRRLVAPSPNHTAVVLWVSVGNVSILLGPDLPETNNPLTGWSQIVDARYQSESRASVFKVPHHGSVGSDQPRVWTEMLVPDPFAILTPCVNGNVKLPTRKGVDLICDRTPNAYITSPPKHVREVKRERAVAKSVGEMGVTLRSLGSRPGHVRIRKDLSTRKENDWEVDCFGQAPLLRDV